MESVIQKLFANRRKSSKLAIFCRKSRRAPAVIELPVKEVEKDILEDAVVISRPPPDVRLVLFRECGETSDRRLLFDSKSFEPEKPEKTENCAQNGTVNNNSRPVKRTRPNSLYQYVRGPQDSDILSEMLFGTVGMASRASSLKIHIIKEPSQLMLSRVFCVESMKETTVGLDQGMEYHLQSNRPNPVLSRRKAKTLPVPTPETPHIQQPLAPMSLASSLTSRLTRSDSSSSLMSIFGVTTGSLGSRSMPQQIPSNMRAHSLPPATRQASRDSFQLTQEPYHGMTSRKTKVKIGIGIIFMPEPSNSSEFQRFFFEHFPLIESYVTFLKEQVENALNRFRKTKNSEFVEAMMEALYVFANRFNAIYSTPRLPKPVWSTLTSKMSEGMPWTGNSITIECFIADLTRMVQQHNTKNKDFFMSRLVTAVLTHHLGWVNTALPPCHESQSPMLAYNPLWTQLGDLYGSVGTPTKVAKTVILGEIHEVVSTIISILSYFIRCSNVSEVVPVPSEITPRTFLSNVDDTLQMSSVPSDLETDYVFVSHIEEGGQSTVPKSMDPIHMHSSMKKSSEHNKNASNINPSSEKSKKLSICSKFGGKISEPIYVEKKASISPGGGSTLCRSRSSPGTSTKPQLKFTRQKSSGNMDLLPSMRLRTNSNDTLAKPRGVQSRRTSRDVSMMRRMSQSSSALVIPDSEVADAHVSSLEGSKSLCMDQTPSFERGLLRKRLGIESGGSCPDNVIHEGKAGNDEKSTRPPIPKRKIYPSMSNTTSNELKVSQTKVKTHKRVSSEPFSISQLPTVCGDPIVKTNSIYFDSENAPVVRKTFVDMLQPKVVNVNHVQRSQPVLTRSSPLLPRSKSSAGTQGPIYGFSTPDMNGVRKGVRRVQPSEKSMANVDFKDVFSAKECNIAKKHPFRENSTEGDDRSQDIRRSSSNASTSGRVSRSSSNSSGKAKLAGRRRKLTNDSASFEEEEDTKERPPLQRIPSVCLQHEQFEEYFDDSEYIFFDTKTPYDTQNSSEKLQTGEERRTRASKQGNPSQNTATPPPLPSVGPCHRTLLSEKSTDKCSKPKMGHPLSNNASKIPPQLPAAPPVHRGPLYPILNNPNSLPSPKPLNEITEIRKSSLYPSLADCDKSPYNINDAESNMTPNIYPNLHEETPVKSETPSLYPRLPAKSDISTSKSNTEIAEDPVVTLSESISIMIVANENGDVSQELGIPTGCEEIPLTPISVVEDLEKRDDDADEEKHSRLTFGELLADYSPDYLWGFALHGTRNQSGLHSNVILELQHSVSRPVLDEPVAEAVTIVADTDKWTVQTLSSQRIHGDRTAIPPLGSKLITNILERIAKLYTMKMPADFCLQHLESELGELVSKSRMLARYLNGVKRVKMPQLSAALGIEANDLPLLVAIASCHSPQVAGSELRHNLPMT